MDAAGKRRKIINGWEHPDKFIQVRNRRQLRATVIRLLQLQNEKGLYAGTGSRKR